MRTKPGLRGGFLAAFVMLTLALVSGAEAPEARTPLAEIDGETIYVEDVEGAVAFRIFKHQLDIYSLLKSEAEKRIEERLLSSEARARGITVEAMMAEVEGDAATVSDAEIDRYLAEHPPDGARDPEQARIRVRHYLAERARIARRVAFMEKLHAQAGTKILLEPPTPPRTDVDIAGAPVRGPSTASVEIVHFASFGSRNSARSARKLDQLRAAFPDQIRQIHRNLLNDRDEVGLAAARIAFVAAESDRFWPLHDAIFAHEKPPPIERIEAEAIRLGLSRTQVAAAATDLARLQAVKRDIEAATAAGAPREPGLFINGRFASGLLPYDEISKIVKEEIERARTRPD